MNASSTVNLINVLTQSQPQPNIPIQPSLIQPIYSSQSRSVLGNSIRIFPNNQLLSAIQPTQQIISYSPQHLNEYHANMNFQHKMNHRIKPEQTLYNPLFTSTNSHPSILKLLPSPNTTHCNHMYTMPSSFPTSECTSIIDCCSIKRIIKLGVLNTKYGIQNAQRIADFIDQSQEFNQLNQDYQHSILCHLGNENKDKIDEMSKQYASIYDFIDNFKNKHNTIPPHQRQVMVQELIFYSQTMDTIYSRMAVKQTKTEIIDLISDDKMDGDDNSSNSSNTTHSQPLHQRTNTNNNHILPIHNNYNHNIASNSFIPLFVQSIPSLPPSIRSAIRNQSMQPRITSYKPISDNMIHPIVPKTDKSTIVAVKNNETIPLLKKEPEVIITRFSPFKVESDRKFKCNLCGKQYKHLCNLKSHQKVHTDEALICPHCNKRFGRKANYKEHIRIHTGETPYECTYCQRKFKHHHSWKDHLRIHTGEKPYKCQICNKRFKVGHNLTVHLRIHTGEKPYNCTVCMKAFRQKSALNSHLKRVHH